MMEQKLSSSDINRVVWNACDTFRGVIDPAQYKDYILTMLFLKYVSDVWKDKAAQHAARYDHDPVRIERALRHERFQLPERSTFDYLFERRNEANLGELVNIALEQLEDANRAKLERVFRNIDFNSEANLGQTKDRNRRLKNLLADFSGLDLRPQHLQGNDVIGDAYEYLIENFASQAGKKAGEFYTPKEVSMLLAKLVAPQPGHRIYDPTCGSGSLLIKTAHEVGSSNFSLYGQEINGSTWALARMNMFLHELDNAQIEWGDTLNSPRLIEGDRLMKFDIVVANPPFSLDKWGADTAAADAHQRFHRGVPPKSKGDYAFVSHMIESAREGAGRVGVVLPHGVLFRGSSEGAIRRRLIEENLLDAVVGLPANLFFGTGIPACILLFNRGKGANRDVLFIDASQHFEAGKNQNRLRPQDIAKIVETHHAYAAAPPCTGDTGVVIEPKYAYRATFADLAANDFNLNIPRYVDTFEEEAPVDMAAVKTEIETLKKELAGVEAEMAAYLKELGL